MASELTQYGSIGAAPCTRQLKTNRSTEANRCGATHKFSAELMVYNCAMPENLWRNRYELMRLRYVSGNWLGDALGHVLGQRQALRPLVALEAADRGARLQADEAQYAEGHHQQGHEGFDQGRAALTPG